MKSYFRNALSRARVQQLVENEFGPGEVARIRDLMPEEHDDGAPYNQNAWTFFAAQRKD